MENSKLNRILAWANLLFMFIFISDSFILPKKTYQEIFANASNLYTHGSKSGGYWTYVINTKSGYKYIISRNVGMRLNFGDTLYIDKTTIFKTPLGIIYPTENKYYYLSLGFFNESYLSYMAFAFIAVISILNLTKNRILKNSKKNASLILSSSLILIVCIIFYFWY